MRSSNRNLKFDLMGGVEAVEKPLAASDDRSTIIIRGKRTKLPRTPSSCGGGAAAASSSSVSVGGGGGDYDLSPVSSSGTNVFRSTEEEEDLAYCLILLAQGPRRQTDEDDVDAKLGSVELLRSSKKFSKVATAGGAAATKEGFFVYECKTCCRTFPSFQALGGHRASHKKPRLAEVTKKSPSELNSDEDEEEGQIRKITIGPPACSSPNYPSKVLQSSKPKIHECSICGLEFSSGQALGGHMRRHRAAAAPATSSSHVAMSLNSVTTGRRHDSDIVGEDGSRDVILSLDLNLPAPEDDRKFQFAAAPAQKPLLFSAPALVDCHY